MYISILTYGSRGDVQPFIALGIKLQQAGHKVRIAANTRCESLVYSYGLDFSPVQDDLLPLTDEKELQKRFAAGAHALQVVRDIFEDIGKGYAQIRNDCWIACQGAEAIVDSTPAYSWGYHIAEALNVPYFRSSCLPHSPTRAFPDLLAPRLPLGGHYNFLTFMLTERFTWQAQSINRWRQQTLGLPPLTFARYHAQYQKYPYLYAFSPLLIPKPADWPDWFHVTGFWNLPPNPNWQPPAKLLDFLQAGPPPVYVGFGSMTAQRPEVLAQTVTQALAKAKQRGVLLTGWGGLAPETSSDDVLVIDEAPHTWLFPRMAAIVHHGGVGTTAAALRAGVPSFAVPFNYDQPFWGRRITGLGVGPNPIPLRQVSVDRLANAIQEATHNPAMQKRAAEIGQRLSAEDGVTTAVEAFERHLTSYARIENDTHQFYFKDQTYQQGATYAHLDSDLRHPR